MHIIFRKIKICINIIANNKFFLKLEIDDLINKLRG